jgi:hypothetical protein
VPVESGSEILDRGDDAADDEEGGGGEWGEVGEGSDGGDVLGFVGAGGFGEDADGSFGRDGSVLEPGGDFGVIGAGHVDDDRGFGGEADAREELRFGRTGKRGEKDVGGEAAIGERKFGGGRGSERGGDAGDDFEGNVGGAKGFDFFGGAAEEERVASFEADDGLMFVGGGNEERVDVVLGEEAEAGAFADVDELGGSGDESEDFGGDEGVVEDDFGGLEDA